MFHDEAIGFFRNRPLPWRSSKTPVPERVERIRRLRDEIGVEFYRARMVDAQYVLVGNTGIVCGFIDRARKLKDGAHEFEWSRLTATYIKSGGKWLLLAMHESAIPS